MKRIILALAVGGALFGVVAFAAAGLNLNAGSLSQSGMTDVTDCAGGQLVSLEWWVSGSNPVRVTDVNVLAPYAACVGAVATVEVFDDDLGFAGAGSCTILASGNCLANLPDIDVALVDAARVTLSGP